MPGPTERELWREVEDLRGNDGDDTPDKVVIHETVVNKNGDVVENDETVIEL